MDGAIAPRMRLTLPVLLMLAGLAAPTATAQDATAVPDWTDEFESCLFHEDQPYTATRFCTRTVGGLEYLPVIDEAWDSLFGGAARAGALPDCWELVPILPEAVGPVADAYHQGRHLACSLIDWLVDGVPCVPQGPVAVVLCYDPTLPVDAAGS